MPGFLAAVDLARLTPARLWAALDAGTRLAAAQAYVEEGRANEATRRMAELAIARALRFREASVRKLGPERKASHLARLPADDVLASGLLHALHLLRRRPLLAAFLDALGVAHDEGVIAGDGPPPPPSPEAVADAAAKLLAAHPALDVEVYLASLLAVEPEVWGRGVRPFLERRRPG